MAAERNRRHSQECQEAVIPGRQDNRSGNACAGKRSDERIRDFYRNHADEHRITGREINGKLRKYITDDGGPTRFNVGETP